MSFGSNNNRSKKKIITYFHLELICLLALNFTLCQVLLWVRWDVRVTPWKWLYWNLTELQRDQNLPQETETHKIENQKPPPLDSLVYFCWALNQKGTWFPPQYLRKKGKIMRTFMALEIESWSSCQTLQRLFTLCITFSISIGGTFALYDNCNYWNVFDIFYHFDLKMISGLKYVFVDFPFIWFDV